MSEILEQLTNSTSIAEWIDPWDRRLVRATGRPAPQGGGVDREGWAVRAKDWPFLAAAVKRLIVPQPIAAITHTQIEGDEDWNRVVLTVPTLEDWSECFPVNTRTNIFAVRGLKRWAAVAITDNYLGMGVFAAETDCSVVRARVQHIPQDTIERIIAD